MRTLIVGLCTVTVIFCSACEGASSDGDAPGTPFYSLDRIGGTTCPTTVSAPQLDTAYAATATTQTQALLTNVDVISSACSIDVVSFRFSGAGLPSYEIKHVQAAADCESGLPVTTAGATQIAIRFDPAVAHDDDGRSTVDPLVFKPINFPAIKEMKLSCDYEGVVEWVIGTQAKSYTVTTASDPSRIVVQVSH